jgi:hypothetical protein
MVEPPARRPDSDPTVPEEAIEEPHIRSDEEEDERGARREDQQDHAQRPIWPEADDPFRQAGESSPAPSHRRR